MSIDVNVQNDLVIVTETTEDIVVNVSNAAGPQGPAGAAGVGVPVGGSTGQVLKKFSATNYDTYWAEDASGLTSVGLSVPTGLSVTNSPLTTNGSIAVGLASGYSIPTTASQATWDAAYNDKINSAAVTGTTTKTLTLNQQDGGTITAFWTDDNTDAVTSVFGRTGAVVATSGDYTTTQVTEGTNLYFTGDRVRATLLTGLNLVGGGTIAATDSILQAFGKTQNQISALVGGVNYDGVWNASTNTPAIVSSVGSKGDYYVVNVAGSTNIDGITDWKVGDWIIYNGTTWDKVDNTDAVSSVNGFTGAVSLTTANISEVTNLYYTENRVSANTDVAANTAARHNAVTLGTANGLSLSTQALSLGLSSASTTGALSSTDWTTFNNKQNTVTLTTTGSSGASTLISNILNVPAYTLSGLGGVPTSRTLTINGTIFDLSADRNWSVGTVTGTGVSGQVAYWSGVSSELGSNNLFWDAVNNRLGIGLVNPQRALEVYSAIPDSHLRLSGSAPSVSLGDSIIGGLYQAKFGLATANGQYASASVAGDFVILSQTGATIFMTSATEKMRITAAGRMLLGLTTESTYLLDVNGTSRISGVVTLSNLAGTGSRIVVADANGVLSASSALSNYVTGTGTTNYIPKWTSGSALGNSLVYDNGTNVGIGTTSPSEILHLQSTAPVIRYTKTGILNWYAGNVVGNNYTIYPDSATSSVFNITSTGNLLLNSTTDNGNRLQVTGNGYFSGSVGIGTNLPGYKLDIYDVQGTSMVVGAATGKAYVYGDDAAGTIGTISAIPLRFATNSVERARITAGGNLLVGTTIDSGEKLQVNGSGIFNSTTPLLKLQASDNSVFHGIEFRQGAGFDAFIKQLPVTGEFRISNGRNTSWGGHITFYTDTVERLRIASTGAATFSSSVTAGGTVTSGASGIANGGYDIKRSSDGLSVANFTINTTTSLARLNTEYSFLTFATEGTERMRISVGNVLIGTTTDSGEKLQVSGSGVFNLASGSPILRVAGGGDVSGGGKGNIRSSDQAGANYWDFGRDNLTTGDFVITQYGGSPNLRLATTTGAATFSSSVTTAAPTGGTAKPFKIGAAATVSPTSPNRTIEIEIDGTTYYLSAKTTND